MNTRGKIQKVYPLSPMQEGMLFHYLLQRESTAYFEQVGIQIQGELNLALVEESFNHLIKRYEPLRSIIAYEKVERPLHVVLKERKERVKCVDFSEYPDEEQISKIVKWKEADREQGFDLSKDVLMRITVLKTSQDTAEIIWSFHHLLMDGWCIGIIVNDFLHIYQALSKGESVQLASIYQYDDYINWLERQNKEKAALYWADLLAGYEEIATIPGRACTDGHIWHQMYELPLNQVITKGVTELAVNLQVTVSNILQSIWGVLLQRYNNTTDVVFGTVMSGRQAEVRGIERMIGLFINTIPLRVTVRPTTKFAEVVQDLQKQLLHSGKYAYYPLAEIQSRSSLKQGLFDHLIAYENFPFEQELVSLENEKLPFRIRKVEFFEETNYAFNLIILPGEELVLRFKYDDRVYQSELIQMIAGHWQIVLNTITTNPEILINSLEILTLAEQEHLLITLNNKKPTYPQITIHQIFEEIVTKYPKKVAAAIGTREVSYHELNEQANQLAHLLQAKGVAPETLVGIMLDRSIEMISSIFAVLKAGGAYLPIDPDYPLERIEYITENSQIRYLITDKEVKFGGEVIHVHQMQGLDGVRRDNLEKINHLNHLAYVIYTSGSTGKPKGVMVEHGNVVQLLFNDQQCFDFTQKDVWTIFHSFCFDFSVWEMYGALLFGGKAVIVPKKVAQNQEEFAHLLRLERVTVLNQTPAAFYNLCDVEIHITDQELQLRYIIFGGEALKPTRLRDWHIKYPATRMINMYGITEITVHATFKEITPSEMETNISNIGQMLPPLTGYVMNQNLHLMPFGMAGELCVGGMGVARGYLNQPELTEKRFVPNPYRPDELIYRSGDLVRFLPSGELEYLGRIDRQLKIRGFRVELKEIEAEMLLHPAIQEVAVLAKEDLDGSIYLLAYFVADTSLAVVEIHRHMKSKLPEYMIPAEFVQIEQFPLTTNGKIDWHSLEKISDRLVTGRKYLPPRDKLEIILAQIWEKLLHIEQISIEDQFFELGGHSLKVTQLAAQVKKELNVELPLKVVFEKPTIRELAEFIRGAVKKESIGIMTAEKHPYYPVSSAQKRLYVLEQLIENKTTYNMPAALVIKGEIDKQKLTMVLQELIKRHAALRTSFKMVNGEPVQVVHDEVAFSITDLKMVPITSETKLDVKSIITHFIQPFDLTQAPLFRAGLLKTEDEYLLLTDLHHLIGDGISLEILVKELIQLYSGTKLPILKLQYTDYVLWQKEKYNQFEQFQKAEQYWREIFADEIPLLNLPTDFVRRPLKTFTGSSFEFLLDKKTHIMLKELATKTGTTLYMVLLAVYTILVSKYSGQTDLVVGSPVAGRPHADLEHVFGMFVNTLPLRHQPHGELSFFQYLDQLKEQTLAALQYQDYPFEMLLEILNPITDLSRNPLFDVAFALETKDLREWELPGIKVQPYPFSSQIAKFDLTLFVYEKSEGLECVLEYKTSLFTEETLVRMSGHFTQLIRQILAAPETKIHNLQMISEAEKAQILCEWNATNCTYPATKTIHQIFEEQVQRTPDAMAILCGEEMLTYAELNHWANLVAEQLRKFGANSEQLAGICMNRSLEMMVSIFGILKTGAAYLPLEPSQPVERLNYILQDANPLVVLTQPEVGPLFLTFAGERLCFDWVLKRFEREAKVNSEGYFAKACHMLQKKNPIFSQLLKNQSQIWGDRFASRGEEIGKLLSALLWQDSSLEQVIDAYLEFTYEHLSRSVDFLASGHYRNTDFSNIYMDVYKNEQYMSQVYYPALLISYAFSSSYTHIYEYYRSAFLPEAQGKKTFLEIGFGHGFLFSETLRATQGLCGVGVDISPASVGIAKRVLTARGIDFKRYQLLVGDMRKLSKLDTELSEEPASNTESSFEDFDQFLSAVQNKKFELINCTEVLEHVPDPVEILQIIAGLLAEDGLAFITAAVRMESVDHLYLYQNIAEVQEDLAKAGLQVISEEIIPLTNLDYREAEVYQQLIKDQTTPLNYCAICKLAHVGIVNKQVGSGLSWSDYPREVLSLQDVVSYENTKGASPTSLIYVIYTSGSTGNPKGVMIEHTSVVNRLNWMQKHYQLTSTDLLVQKTPITFDVSVWELFWWSFAGASLFLLPPGGEKDPKLLVDFIAKKRITVLHLVPSMLNVFLDYVELLEDHTYLQSLQRIITSGEALELSQVERFTRLLQAKNGTTIHNLYGPTEATVDVTYFDCFKLTGYGSVPIGKPIDNTQVWILDQANHLQPVGVPGELCIAGVQLARGYLKRPELDADKFIPYAFSLDVSHFTGRMYRSGDLARWLPDGNIEYLGRIDHQVKIRGFRIELGEIENRLNQHPVVKKAVVIDSTDASEDHFLIAYIVPAGEIEIAILRRELATVLPVYMVPAHFVILKEIPLTQNGKVNRHALPKPEFRVSDDAKLTPRNQREEHLAQIWCEVLGLNRIGIYDHFTELGGHSLKGIEVTSLILKEMQIEISLADLFRHPTIATLATFLEKCVKRNYDTIQPLSKQEYYELSYLQKRLWVIHELEKDSLAYNMPGCVTLQENVNLVILRQALETLVSRHESLRTHFKKVAGRPVQVVNTPSNIKVNYVDISTPDHQARELERQQVYEQERCKPFDLENGPLFRVTLVKCDEEDYDLIYCLHHIISDGYSMQILKEDFTLLYTGLKAGKEVELPPLVIQYKDFAAWQNRLLSDPEKMKQSKEYWASQLSGELPVLKLPANQNLNEEYTDAAAYRSILSAESLTGLKKIAEKEEVSLFMVLLAGFTVYLSHLTGQSDLLFGIPVAGRNHAHLRKVMGMFVNTIIQHNYVVADETFTSILQRVQENMFKALEFQDCPLELVVEELKIKFPQIDIFFNMLNLGETHLFSLEDRESRHTLKVQETKFGVIFYLTEYADGVEIDCHYLKQFYDPETIEYMVEKYIQEMGKISANANYPLSDYNAFKKMKHQLR